MNNKMTKDEFLDSYMGFELVDCIRALEKSIVNEDRRERELQFAKLDVFKIFLFEIFGVDYHFTRTGKRYGLITEDGNNILVMICK